MIKTNDIDNLELLLKEKSDEFKMYPSKKIWHSLYNNLHPGRKWPSITMSLILITALLLIGYLNTNNNPANSIVSATRVKQNSTDGETNIISVLNAPPSGLNNSATASSLPLLKNSMNSKSKQAIVVASTNSLFKKASSTKNKNISLQDQTAGTVNNNNVSDKADNKSTVLLTGQTKLPKDENPLIDDNATESVPAFKKTRTPIENNTVASLENTAIDHTATGTINTPIPNKDLSAASNRTLSNVEKAWIEEYALYNRPVPAKWADRLKLQVYATPSVVYRTLVDNEKLNTASSTNAAIYSPGSTQDINSVINQRPSIGIEVGTGIQYAIIKGLNVKTGIQLNFTRYNSLAFENTHPIGTTLTLVDDNSDLPYQVFRNTPYSNNNGIEPVKLHNETFQISIPLGVEMKLAGTDNLQWNIGATIQPTFLMGGQSYLLSSDIGNYVKESDFLNRWNLNAGFETFISYKINGLSWQLGPQFRSQLFSTNSKKYLVEEKLNNYGIKFGVSKTLH